VPTFSSEPDGYTVVHDITPQDDIKSVLETDMADDHMVRLARGTYTSSNWVILRGYNKHIYVNPADYGFVFIRAPMRFEGANHFRITGVDFLDEDDSSINWCLNSDIYATDCTWKHTVGKTPWSGSAINAEFSRYVITALTRHNDINFLSETTAGTPVKFKDNAFFRCTGSENGFLPRIFFGKDCGIQMAGSGGYLHDISVQGPGKTTNTTGIQAIRSTHIFFLKSLGSSIRILNCGTGLQAVSGGRITVRAEPSALILNACNTGLDAVEGGVIHLSNRTVKGNVLPSVAYINCKRKTNQDSDEAIIQ
jgi:hypothetical protein